ncbi:saccharopine dehydrogenase NADP-binding domain-containing protein [Aeromicrobium sp. IC_218]|uniref:saccharopine dehydrogenase family protein n=1 Tax=Aeromicrobium sp. IC_218 TaxID=2545468 RepID=UPI001038D653|nr:saccharopine dehydrogenase NADP-binding domain-containing protein [Aeromicrobium sp. IC_218]TCI97435.1 saccharopine dehydrogenase [Aeromicrobium sp. IC_218]
MSRADVTLLGATGFTGGLTAEYLAAHVPAGATWAIAGRRREKLEQVADRVEAAGGSRPELRVADVEDAASMRELAASTKVLATTVGPYLQHGEAAVQASAAAGTDYVDLTGEPEFVDRTWLRHHGTAERTGARLVHACGFDSVPYDLGVLWTVEQLPDDVPITVRGYVRSNAAFSGGTYHSAINVFGRMKQAKRTAAERRRLEPRPADRRVRGGGSFGKGPGGVGYGVPLPTLDPQIVLRSARALPAYGPDFRYEHFAHVKKARTLAVAGAGLGVAFGAAQLPPTRALMLKAFEQGTGPDEERRDKSYFKLVLEAEAGDQRLRTQVSGGDPGYTETSKMLAESALSLAFDDLPEVAGQTTTAVAMGDALVSRLQAAGIRFDVLD